MVDIVEDQSFVLLVTIFLVSESWQHIAREKQSLFLPFFVGGGERRVSMIFYLDCGKRDL